MSSVDLKKNRSSLVDAYNEVFNPKSDTNWVLYGYEGQTNVLKVVSKGDGGIEEMIDELNSGKIMYAFCRVQDPNTDLPKFVLINWQGEGVPEIKKGSCTSHQRDISNFLKGAHVTIHARTEDDVDVDDITKKVAKSSGANYSFHKEKAKPEMYEPAGPVGTKYERVKPQLEIKPNIRDKFWKQQQEEEKQRQEELQRKAREDKERMERERREREEREARQREEREQERMKKIYERKKAEREAEEKREADMKKKWEETQIEAMKDEEERRKRADRLRKERANEAQSLVSQRAMNPRQVFEQKTSQFDEPPATMPPPRKLKHGFLDEPTSQFDEPKAPAEPPRAEPVPQESKAEEPKVEEPEVEEPKVEEPKVEEPKVEEPSPVAQPPIRNMLAQNLPKRQDSDEEQAWEDEIPETKPQSEPMQDQNIYDDTAAVPTENPSTYDDVGDVQPAGDNIYDDVQTGGETFPPEKGLVARALYDYQACEDNEVSFDPGDLITNIIQIDPGWWVGTTPDGSNGMFPSNYVELLNG